MSKPVLPADLSRVTTYPLASRSNKVRVDVFARPVVAAAEAHVIKVGLAPILIGMMEEWTISALALTGGVWINLGSAVLLPEVFLKALSIAVNLGLDHSGFATANLDLIRQYRTDEIVLRRPVLGKGKSFSLTGHHELNLPLLAAAVGIERTRRDSGG